MDSFPTPGGSPKKLIPSPDLKYIRYPFPIRVRSSGSVATGNPLQILRAIPFVIPHIPIVAINGGTL